MREDKILLEFFHIADIIIDSIIVVDEVKWEFKHRRIVSKG